METEIQVLRKVRQETASRLQRLDRALAVLEVRAGAVAAPKKATGARAAAPKRRLSAAGRKAISIAAKKRWAAYKKAGAKAGGK